MSTDYQPYSWHQSHDQATVLLILPNDIPDDDVQVVIERSNLIAGVRGEPPLIKGRLYGQVDPTHSDWLLEPSSSSSTLSARERTASTASTTSTQSSFALVSSDPDIDITSSFAASLASGATSEADPDDLATVSPSHSSPHSSADERVPAPRGFSTVRRRLTRRAASASLSASPADAPASLASSRSSFAATASTTGRLLTVHLEKAESAIWPALVVGPAPPTLDAPRPGPSANEQPYNMDPTSLALVALELADVRDDRHGAFEFFLRAWLHARVPTAAMRLVSNYVPPQATPADPSALTFPPPDNNDNDNDRDRDLDRERTAYYVRMLGGARALAQLYLDAGLMHLEGTASALLSSSHSPLASIRIPDLALGGISGGGSVGGGIGSGGTAAWRRDREAARVFFERARALAPDLDVPVLLPDPEGEGGADNDGGAAEVDEKMKLEMPTIDVDVDIARTRRKLDAEKTSVRGNAGDDEEWYFAIPGIVGAGTALLVVGIVGAIGFSSWRRNQS